MIDTFFITLYQKNPNAIALKEIVDKLYMLVNKREFLYLDIILGKSNINRMDDVIIIAILRTTYEARGSLKHWNSFLSKAKRKLTGADLEKQLAALA